jgi:glycolate oxidase iron-sulfur subunit
MNKESALNLDYCVRCGSCKALCPTYSEEGVEGMSARGRVVLLRELESGSLAPSALLDKMIFSCMLCGACNKLCPLGIDITGAVYEGRKKLNTSGRKRKFINFAAKLAFIRTAVSFRALKFLESINEVFPFYRIRPFSILRKLGVSTPAYTLRDGASLFKVPGAKGRIAVFAGCTVNYLYPRTGEALIRSLNALRYDVVLPKGEVCCGAPLLGLGLEKEAAELAQRNMNTFSRLKVEAVVGLCPTCVHFVKNEYKGLVGSGMDNAVDVTQFFSSGLPPDSLRPPAGRDTVRAVYHDPCHSLHHLGVSAEPRQLMASMGYALLDAERGCCGFGGTFRLLYPGLSEGILRQTKEQYRKADLIVTSCPNCVLQLRSAIEDREVKHIVELIAERLQENGHEREKKDKR